MATARPVKTHPFSNDELLELSHITETPFHVYDEKTIRDTCRAMKDAFSWAPKFKNFYAVKAAPNPHIIKILLEEGMGADCSSLTELFLSEATGFKGEDIIFTSNNTALKDFKKAKSLQAVINLDDISHLEFIHEKMGLPELICARFNPGPARVGNVIIGDPKSAKFGMTSEQIFECFSRAKELGVTRFALHTMVVSNCLNAGELIETARMMFDFAVAIQSKLGIKLEFVNLGGGIGVPYTPEATCIDIKALGASVKSLFEEICVVTGLQDLGVYYECGRYITAPAGVLVTRVIHQKNIYKKFVGVDAAMNCLMRPALYGSYHHISVMRDDDPAVLANLPSKRNLFPEAKKGVDVEVDVVGSLCENNDKLAIDRQLPSDINIGDLLIFHDTGAHGHAMGNNYNGKPRSAEFLRTASVNVPSSLYGNFLMIRRAEEYSDITSTVRWSA